jgi:hypothetical protein
MDGSKESKTFLEPLMSHQKEIWNYFPCMNVTILLELTLLETNPLKNIMLSRNCFLLNLGVVC